MVNREEIYKQIDAEREYQNEKWGAAFDEFNNVNDWVAYITRYAGKVNAFPFDKGAFRTSMVKVAALAVAAIESIDAGIDLTPQHLPTHPSKKVA